MALDENERNRLRSKIGIYLANMYTEITGGVAEPSKLPLVCVSDNKSLCDAVRSNKGVSEKRLRLEIANLKEMLENKLILGFRLVESNKQLADTLTKKGASPYILMKTFEAGVLEI